MFVPCNPRVRVCARVHTYVYAREYRARTLHNLSPTGYLHPTHSRYPFQPPLRIYPVCRPAPSAGAAERPPIIQQML